jgi:hypothetical protein
LTVGFFSPLPPARSGVADYSAELSARARAARAVKVNARGADVPLYHLGNNPLHAKSTAARLKRPAWRCCTTRCCIISFLGGGNEREYVAEFVYNYGHWSEDLARELWRRRSRSAADPEYFRYPMIKRIVERSQRRDRA